MPDSLATRCGGIDSSQNAWMMRRGDRVVPAAGAQRRDRPLVVAARQPDGVLLQRRVVDLGFGDVGHASVGRLVDLDMRPSRLRLHAGDHVVRAHREPAVVAHRLQLLHRHAGLEHQQAPQLPVAVLLDDEVDLVRVEELPRPRRRTGSRARACSRAPRLPWPAGPSPRCRPHGSRRPSPAPSSRPAAVWTTGAGTARAARWILRSMRSSTSWYSSASSV